MPVLALREGSSILVEGESASLLGPARRSDSVTWEGARLFRTPADGGAREVAVGESLDFLMRLAGEGGDGTCLHAELFDVMPLMNDDGQFERRRPLGGAADDGFKSG